MTTPADVEALERELRNDMVPVSRALNYRAAEALLRITASMCLHILPENKVQAVYDFCEDYADRQGPLSDAG